MVEAPPCTDHTRHRFALRDDSPFSPWRGGAAVSPVRRLATPGFAGSACVRDVWRDDGICVSSLAGGYHCRIVGAFDQSPAAMPAFVGCGGHTLLPTIFEIVARRQIPLRRTASS